MYLSVYSRIPIPAAAADWMIRSSTSVTFITCITLYPRVMQETSQNVLKHEGSKIPDMREGVDRRAAGINANLAGMHRIQRLEIVRKVLCSRISFILWPMQNGYCIRRPPSGKPPV